MLHFALAGALALASPSYVHQVRNYQQVICDDEPDKDQCERIRFWYLSARSNERTSCCGIADAYWADQVDKVTDKGLFVTVTDRRDCEYENVKPRVEEDDEGNYTTVYDGQPCITGRVLRDGQKLFIPNDHIDQRKQGNPTGHQIVFISAGGLSNYLGDGTMYPSIICAFPGFTG